MTTLERQEFDFIKVKVEDQDQLLKETTDLIEAFVQEWKNTKKFMRIFKVLSFVSRLILELNKQSETIKQRV